MAGKGGLSLGDKVKRGSKEYMAARAAATATPSTNFGQKSRAPIFDDLSPAFDRAQHAAAQAKVKAEKVRILICSALSCFATQPFFETPT
jgi:hypothetical protein